MAVRIGHASIDENRKATGGTAGDQTGKEVCIRSWYDGGWGFVARAKDPAVAEAMAWLCEAGCNNTNIGYDQSGRNTLLEQAIAVHFDLSKITNPCEADCSSFVSVIVRAALGRDFYSGNAPTTRTLKTVLKNTGAFEILEDSKYLTSDKYLRRGDILDNPGKHVVMILDDGANADKTETAQTQETVKPQGVTYSVQLPLLKKGSTGESVKALQILLKGLGYDLGDSGPNKDGIDGDFGSKTEAAVKAFQKAMGLTVDGQVGGQTWAALLT